ncbi:PREDICTED: wall-associated receptor kinase 2-like [Nelumbo nucifera]|uniref:Wall-associated receptor kinase 2-like n=2 Tax=Nelumbo nucifera TaxID=4432 RepID=A0A1U8AYH4_NELNU|nr:PREDICTED: wall-associated receptor kinase 2-like [Nelumbo nucifera]DAD42616.1 TPA_asm: hypothetical protein HUJ06_000846 [Nelumbo nucifera]
MALVVLILLQLLLWWPPPTTAISSTVSTAKTGCQKKCGSVTVPYPFGLDDDPISCYRERFKLHCNRSLDPPILYIGNIEVLEISLLPAQLRVLNYIGYDCYNSTSGNDKGFPSFKVNSRPFTFSDTRNRFTVIGCDNFARITGFNGRNFTSGCSMICNDQQSGFINGSCSGIGCCQTSIPKGFKSFKLYINSYHNHTDVLVFNPCAYAFLVDSEWYNFSVSDLGGYMDFYNRNRENVPMVLDWAIENYTCETVSRIDPSYACRSNSQCFNSPNGRGYLCNCSLGYQGNPYLDDGCQDIDECADEAMNECKSPLAVCTNTPGSYTCYCPSGTVGDGRKTGTGCTAIQGKRSPVMQIALGISFGILVVLFIGSWIYWGIEKRNQSKRKEMFFQQNGGLLLKQQLSSCDGNEEIAKIFTEEELKKATNNYDETRILGRGGYGIVYQGFLPNNRKVAIKKSKIMDENQVEQFINEVVVLSQINHKNVVKLLGCCLEAEVPLLVYEFITNGTLFHHIHDEGHKYSISWDDRLRIASETAAALAYLHSAASPPIIHRDVKSANILLDDNYMAKVSDFGASRLIPSDKIQVTTLVQGTLGYLDPEYFHTSRLTEKSDVYSFGIVLVELLTGRKALDFDRPENEKNLATHFVTSMKEENVLVILEDRVLQEASEDQLKEVTNLANRCLSVKGEERPTMKEVAMELEGLRRYSKHPWVEHNHEEAECLLGQSSNLHSCKADEYDSLKDRVVISLDSGR